MTMNVPFCSAVLLMYSWRKVTVAGVWIGVLGSAFVNILFPLAALEFGGLALHPTLVTRTTGTEGRPVSVYFDSVVRTRADDPASPLEGRGRLHTELLILRAVGVDVVNLSPGGRLAGRFFVDGMLPILLILGASLLTRPPARDRVDQFFGKMKTPVGPTPDLEAAAVAETQRDPHRFDHLKLARGSAWEFTRWDKVDAAGFAIACVVTLAILGLFWALLRWAAP